MADTKLKMLRVLDILTETDPDHPLTTAQIADQLSLFGLSAERKAINRDIHVLQEAGYDIRPCPDNKPARPSPRWSGFLADVRFFGSKVIDGGLFVEKKGWFGRIRFCVSVRKAYNKIIMFASADRPP
jgi:biotin operon repressor